MSDHVKRQIGDVLVVLVAAALCSFIAYEALWTVPISVMVVFWVGHFRGWCEMDERWRRGDEQ